MDLTTTMSEVAAVLVGEGARLSLSVVGMLVGVCFGIISFLPKFIDNPVGPGGEVVARVQRRNERFALMIRRARRTAMFLLTGAILLWLAALAHAGPWVAKNSAITDVARLVAVAGGVLIIIGLFLFLYAIVRYPIGELTTWEAGVSK